MTVTQAIETLLLTLIIFSSIGVLVRCYQEQLNFVLWPIALIVFYIFIVVLIITPIALFFMYILNKGNKKLSLVKRLLMSVISIPIGCVYLIIELRNIIENQVWGNLVKLNEVFSSNEAKSRVITPNIISGPMRSSLRIIERKLDTGLYKVHL